MHTGRRQTEAAGTGAGQSVWQEEEEGRLQRVSPLMRKNQKNKALKGSKSNRSQGYSSINSTQIRSLSILVLPAKILQLASNLASGSLYNMTILSKICTS